ncbi:MAG TPA: zinc ribbon domain-containing protein [Vicinamibacterales bacterium]|nr:zinc ribbon domain-containing protein [Vicinamibacterales bacterium]
MPLYEYECDACGRRFEVIQKKFSDPPVDVCKECGKGPVRRLLSSPAIQFKGSGWYITDYAKKSSSDGGATGTGGADKKDKKAETSDKSDSTTKTDSASSTNTTKSEN